MELKQFSHLAVAFNLLKISYVLIIVDFFFPNLMKIWLAEQCMDK